MSAKQKVYETVKDWIIEGQFQPGERVSDIEIADFFHISRTPVREALQLLESQKLVKTYPGKATIVTELGKDNIEKWYLPMVKLQQLGMSLAVPVITQPQLKQLRRLSEAFEEAVKEQDKPMKILSTDKNFHMYILEIAGNEYIIDFCNILWIHIQRLEYSFFRDTVLAESLDEHERIIEALEMKDCYSAELLIKDHWERTALVINEMNHK